MCTSCYANFQYLFEKLKQFQPNYSKILTISLGGNAQNRKHYQNRKIKIEFVHNRKFKIAHNQNRNVIIS
jgi:hypothetical protein